jgi:hypothetical protein
MLITPSGKAKSRSEKNWQFIGAGGTNSAERQLNGRVSLLPVSPAQTTRIGCIVRNNWD